MIVGAPSDDNNGSVDWQILSSVLTVGPTMVDTPAVCEHGPHRHLRRCQHGRVVNFFDIAPFIELLSGQ